MNQSVYLALGVTLKDTKTYWVYGSQKPKALPWLNVLTELRNRGVEHIFIACVDGLRGFPDAITAAFPTAQIQLCIVHMIRNSLKYVP